MKCDLCGREVSENEIYAFYPEDSSYICKNCFGKSKEEKNEEREKEE